MPCISQKGLDELVSLCAQFGGKKRRYDFYLRRMAKQKKQVN